MTALESGIHLVAIGKRGSKDCPEELLSSIAEEITSQQYDPISLALFLTTLYIKGLSPQEDEILKPLFPDKTLQDPETLVQFLTPQLDSEIHKLLVHALSAKHFENQAIKELGEFLFLSEGNDIAKAIFSIILRVRYESLEEYLTLLEIIQSSLAKPFQQYKKDLSRKIIQIAEPFDGVERSYMITPLLSSTFSKLNCQSIYMVGESAGPKMNFNLRDLLQKLEIPFIHHPDQMSDQSTYGYAFDQKDLVPTFKQWIPLRKKMLKRTFFSTLEKYINPIQADIVMASAFHAGYLEKMTDLALGAGFSASVVTFRSLEGTLGLSLSRTVQYLCAVKNKKGGVVKKLFQSHPSEFSFAKMDDPSMDPASLNDNLHLIKNFMNERKSGSDYFDAQVEYTNQVYHRAIKWILEHLED